MLLLLWESRKSFPAIIGRYEKISLRILSLRRSVNKKSISVQIYHQHISHCENLLYGNLSLYDRLRCGQKAQGTGYGQTGHQYRDSYLLYPTDNGPEVARKQTVSVLNRTPNEVETHRQSNKSGRFSKCQTAHGKQSNKHRVGINKPHHDTKS